MRRISAALIGSFALTACTAHNLAAPTALVSAPALVEMLEHLGANVSIAEQMPRDSFPFFAVNAQRLLVNGRSVHVFAYPDAAAAAADAARVAPSGTPIGGTQTTWTDPPRFYTRGQLIVLYVGRDEEVSKFLESLMGPPFAGKR